MKKSSFLLFAAIMIAGARPPAAAQERGLEVLAREIVSSPTYEIGKRYAVIIGIDRYEEWPPLGKAAGEAKELKRILSEKYYFDGFFELYDADATVANIRKLFAERLPAAVDLHDSVLVFFAGHGFLDSSKSGFWIPVDGGVDKYAQKAWFPNAQLRNYIGLLKARSVLVVADACFSGDLLDVQRGAAPEPDSAYFKRALTLTSRQVLSSGASEAVPDESEFGRQLLAFLDRNTDEVVDALAIYDRVRRGVTKTLPLFGSLPGNEQGASFVLFRRGAPSPAPARAAPTEGRLVIRSAGPYAARSAPIGREGELVPIEGNSLDFKPGSYLLLARLPDDVDDSLRMEFAIRAGEQTVLSLPKLERSAAFKARELAREKERLETELAKRAASVRGRRLAGWIAFGAGIASGATAVFGYLDGSAAYGDYLAADSTEAADAAKARAKFDSALMWAALGSGGASLLVSPILLLGDPTAKIVAAIADIDAQIEGSRK